MPTTVKSPYNFVPAPAEKDVYKPDWADQVSHDKPFSDGESGEMTLKITAETPIFIRNGLVKGVEDNEFSHVVIDGKKKYFIPATSLKGMFRNVLEIMSFSRMHQINNHRHSVRQIMKTKDYVMNEQYELTGKEKLNVSCGYLIQEEGEYFIYSCGKPLKIRYTELDEALKTKFGEYFGTKMLSGMDKSFASRTAEYKYNNLLHNKSLEHSFEKHSLDGEGESSWKSVYQPLDYVRFSNKNANNSFTGRIVCAGQATPYTVSTARKGEYVFRGSKNDVLSDKTRKLKVSKGTIETFLFLSGHNKGKNEELADWAYWKDKITTGIPVFFRRKGELDEVLDLGLTFMYKQPVEHSIKESNPVYIDSKSDKFKMDLSQAMFGSINENNTLKGRVMFSHCEAHESPVTLYEKSVLLASPKSSFTPFYLNQNGTNGRTHSFSTYNNNPRLRGFKRYPVRSKNQLPGIEDQSVEMLSKFRPLDKSTVFSGKVRFHNLRKVEIGALISAITLHNTPNVFHSLGGMKPFGYGRIKVEIVNSKGLKYDIEEYLKDFECEMKAKVGSWSEVVSELITMSSLQSPSVESSLEYMDLDNFQKIKSEGLYLQTYSEITQNPKAVNEYCSSRDVEKRLADYEQRKRDKQQEIDDLKSAIIRSRSENDFQLAIKYLNQLNSRLKSNKSFSYENELNLIREDEARYERLQIEYMRFEEVLNSSDISSAEKFIQDYPISTHINEVERHLSRLKATSGIPDRLKSLKDFKMFAKEAPRWLNKVDKSSFEDFRGEFTSTVTKLILLEQEKPKTKRDWEGDFEKVRNWNKVSEWIGVNEAKKIWDLVNKS